MTDIYTVKHGYSKYTCNELHYRDVKTYQIKLVTSLINRNCLLLALCQNCVFTEISNRILILPKIYFLVCFKYFLWHWIKSCDFCWQDPNRLDVFRICLEAELVPLNVQDFRRKLLFLQKLQFDIVQKSIPVGPFTLVSGESFNNMLKVFWW